MASSKTIMEIQASDAPKDAVAMLENTDGQIDPIGDSFIKMGKRSIFEIRRDLSQRFPAFEKEKEQGGSVLTFIPWYQEVRLLSHYTNHQFEYEVVMIETVQQDMNLPVITEEWVNRRKVKTDTGERIVKRDTWIRVKCRIKVHTLEGTFSFDGTGFESMDKQSYGDPQSTAESMALRRAATKLGLGLYLYIKE